jgi:hypothetical protein
MRYFFYISWATQLMVAVGLFSVSLLIQFSVLQLFLNATAFAFALALTMVIAKVNAIVWHRYFSNQYNNAYPKPIRWACFMFKVGLFGLSILCSAVYLSNRLASGNQEIIIAAIQLTNTLFNWQPLAPQIISIFSILLSLMIELGILLSFEILTVSMQSLMQKQQAFELDKQVLMAQVHSQQQMDNVKHNADVALIRSAVDKTVSKAKANIS